MNAAQPGTIQRTIWHGAAITITLIVMAVSGCALTPTMSPTGNEPSIPTLSFPTPTVLPSPTPIPTQPPRLTLWVTEFVSPASNSNRAQVFAQQIAAFQAVHPDLDIEVIRKKSDGKGGVRDMLTTASAVAPAVLPDLVALDVLTLRDMAREGILAPLDGLLPSALLSDLYPFAIQAGAVQDRLMGVQFQANIEYAVYNTSKIAVPPLTWDELFNSGATYILPIAGRDGLVNDAFLIQYLSAGGELVDAAGNPALNKKVLVDVLTFYQYGLESGTILSDSLKYRLVEDCWPKYLQAQVTLSNISANLYLSGRSLLEPVSVATSIPTRDGKTLALSRGYAWALIARDATRQANAIKMLEWLLYSPNLAAWNQAAGYLPTRRSAMELMGHDAWAALMYNQLENTRPYTTSETLQRVYRAMQEAVKAVAIDHVAPETAADNLLKSINQEQTR